MKESILILISLFTTFALPTIASGMKVASRESRKEEDENKYQNG